MSNNPDNFNCLYNEQLSSIIPFLTERKFCYHNPSKRRQPYNSKYSYINNNCVTNCRTLLQCSNSEGQDSIETGSNDLTLEMSHQSGCTQILKTYGTIKEPDDIIKDNIINTFSLNMLQICKEYLNIIILQNSISKNDNNTVLLDNTLNDDINLINNSINKIKNKKLIKKKQYNSTYYQNNKYKLLTNIIINSLTIICVYIISNKYINDSFSNKILLGLFILTLITYLSITILTLRNRKYSNWNIRYFGREPNDKI